MPKVIILGQAHKGSGKMLIRGVFSTKKNLWSELEKLSNISSLIITDDVEGKSKPADYNFLCDRLRVVGRASLMKDGNREFQIVEANMNELRGWDLNEEGKPVCNPMP